MRRAFGVAFGLVVQAVFLGTVWYLFWFLKGATTARDNWSAWLDLGLALQFCLSHSVLLLPAVRNRLERAVPAAFYGSFYCLVTCASLLTTIGAWQASPTLLVRLPGAWAALAEAGFYASWLALFYSLSLTGLGYQTGWTPWFAWLRDRPQPRREFHPRGAYRLLRHPVYLSFLGLLWFSPTVTVDRALLVAVWSTYIFIGSILKDRRLIYYLGDTYRAYQARVSGYPFFRVGPLARVPWTEPATPSKSTIKTLERPRGLRRAA